MQKDEKKGKEKSVKATLSHEYMVTQGLVESFRDTQ